MKPISAILLSLAMLLSTHLLASHIVGGVIEYECLGGNDYLITLKVYRDCNPGNSNFDNNPTVGIYEGSTLIESVTMSLSDAIVTELPLDTGDPCLIPPDDVCVEEAIYTGEVTLPMTSVGYILAYQRCCRNTTILNVPAQFDNLGSTFFAEIPPQELAVCNSNPAFNLLPPILLCVNEPFVFDHSATDLDGDSLVYEFCNPKDGGLPGVEMNPPTAPPYIDVDWNAGYSFDYPIDSDPAFTINSETGLFEGTPNMLGQYVVGICVKEYRNGELLSTTNRDFQFNIVNCGQSFISSIQTAEPCQGLTIDFGNNSVGTDDYFWDFGVEGLESDTSILANPTYTYPDTGTYVVTLIASPGFECADSSEITIYAYDPIEASFDILDSFCQDGGRIFQFDGTGEYTDNAIFNWSFGPNGTPNSSNEMIPLDVFFDTPGTYTINYDVWDHNCTAEYSEEIVVDPVPVAIIAEQLDFCGGLTVQMTSESLFADEFLWDFGDFVANDTSTEENPEYTYGSYDTYVVTLTVDPGTDCESSAVTEVVVLPENPIEFNYNVIAPVPCDSTAEVFLQFLGTGADVVEWDLGDGNTLEGYPQYYEYEEPGDYTVTVTAYHELCDVEVSEQVDILYDLSVIDAEIIVPNVFSPNRDGTNDTFRIFYRGESGLGVIPPGRNFFDYLSNYSMKIFDRWGVLMFDTETDGNQWDGRLNGKNLVEGTYYYIITYQRKCLDDEVTTQTGTVEILR